MSVFSKTYDPDTFSNGSSHSFEDNSSSLNDEDIANRIHENTFNSKTSEEGEMLSKVLLSIILFKHLNQEHIENIVDSMFERKCKKNEVIIREGDEGKYFYVITKGVFDVYKTNKKSSSCEENNVTNGVDYGIKVATLKDKGYFGELSLLYDQVLFMD